MPDLEEDRSKENATQDGAENFSETSTDSKPLSKRCSERSGRRFIQSGPPETKSCLVAWSRDVFIAALCAVLLSLAAQYLPGIGLVASVFLPLPIAMALMRQGILGGVFSGVLMLLILIFICGVDAASRLFLQYGLIGLSMGYCFLHGKSPLRTIVITTVIYLLGEFISIGITMVLAGLVPADLFANIEENYADFLAMMQANGLSVDPGLAEEFVVYALNLMKKLLPGILVMSGLVTVFLCYLVSAAVLRRQGYSILRMRKFDLWHMDWPFVWGLIGGLLFFWLGNLLDLFWMACLGGSLLLVFGPIVALCGISIFIWLLKTLPFSGVLKGIACVFVLLFIPVSFYGLLVLAIFDSVRDLRPRILTWLRNRE